MCIFFVLLIVSYYFTNSCFSYGEVPSELAKFLCLVRALEPVSRKSRQLTVRAQKAVFMFAVLAFKVKISIIFKNDRMKLLVNEAKLRERVASGCLSEGPRSVYGRYIEFLMRTFHYRAVSLWNSLPERLTELKNLASFKKEVMRHLQR